MDFADLAVGPAPQLPLDVYRKRRKALARRLGDGNALVVATHTTKQYSNDVEYLYRPHSDFWYLTGFDEPRAALVLHGGSGATDLFVQPRRKEAEIWTGRRLGVERAPSALGIDRAHSFDDLAGKLAGVLGKEKVHAISDHDPAVRRRIVRIAGRRLVPNPVAAKVGGPESALLKGARRPTTNHGRELLHEMRLVKEPEELAMLKAACDLGVDAHLECATRIRPGARESAVEASFAQHARSRGSTGVGYPSICGCGPNAAVLHYVTNRDALRKGKLFLIDAGCEWGWYTSDITRTYPVGAGYSRVQGEMYDLVAAAHKAALKEVKPGNAFRAPHQKAVDVITTGLLDHGFLEGSFESAVKEQTYRRYFMHGTSHWLGLDVHDAGSPNGPDGKPRLLKEGMCLTVEPGLYFNPDFSDCPPKTVGIGIRIEDDVAVTADGNRNLTKRLPVERDAVAALVG
ncbi:MAG: Xaa-Pro aminopeptidase [Thermoplasmata archaeon]|nr:Xaa-Pro aminopeptidase [Thermoplasmata archaeon]